MFARRLFKATGVAVTAAAAVAVAAQTETRAGVYLREQTTALWQAATPVRMISAGAVPRALLAQAAGTAGLVAHSRGTDWKAVRSEIEAVLAKENCGPLLVRLSWHAAGTVSVYDGTGGCGATMRFAPESGHGANAGLGLARDLLEPIKQRHPELSYSDLWAFAACVAIDAMGGPRVPFRSGRKDLTADKCTPDGRLPDATKYSNHIRDIFYRMGMNDQEIVALVGAHTLGEAHKDRSGFSGPWTRDPYGFDNSFFIELIEQRWQIKPGSNPEQFEDAATKELMMLPADIAFIQDPSFRHWVEIYARDADRFNRDFARAFQKLQEAGVPTGSLSFFAVN